MFRFDPRNVDQISFQLAVDLKLFPRTSIQIASRLISSISRGGGGANWSNDTRYVTYGSI